MKIPATFAVILFFLSANGQAIDSLRKKLASFSKLDTNRVDVLNKLSWQLAYSNSDSAILLANQSFKIADDLRYYHGAATAHYITGALYYLKNDYKHAEEHLFKTIDYALRHNTKKTLSDALNCLGAIHQSQGNFVQALDNFLQSLKIREQLKSNTGILSIYNNLGILYMELGDNDASIKYSLKSLALCDSFHNVLDKTLSINNIGLAYIAKNDYRNALKYCRSAYELIKKDPENKLLAARFTANIGLCYLKMDSLEKADKYLGESFLETKNLHAEEDHAVILNELCELRLKQNRPVESIPLGEKALRYFQETHNKNHLLNSLLLLSKASAILQYHQKALEYSNLAYAINDSLKTEKLIINLSDLQKGYEMAKKETQIDLLSQQAKAKELQFTREQNEKYSLAALAFLLVIVSGFAYAGFRAKTKLNKELKEKYAEIQEQKDTIETVNYDLRSQALCAQMNPHFIFNCMTAVDGFILKNERQRSSDLLTSFAQLTRLVLENSERKLISLEQELKCLELYLKIEKLRFGDAFQYDIHCNTDLDFDIPPLLLQPYVENAIIHGIGHETVQHKKIVIQIESESDGKLIIKITDNGVGRRNKGSGNPNVPPGHRSMGMRITAERLALLRLSNKIDAQMEILDLIDSSGMPNGTQVKVSLKKEEIFKKVHQYS